MDKLNEWIGRDPAMDRSLERVALALLELGEGDVETAEGLRDLKRAARGLFNAAVSRDGVEPGSPDEVEEAVRQLVMACRAADHEFRRGGRGDLDLGKVHIALSRVFDAHAADVRDEQLSLVHERFPSR